MPQHLKVTARTGVTRANESKKMFANGEKYELEHLMKKMNTKKVILQLERLRKERHENYVWQTCA